MNMEAEHLRPYSQRQNTTLSSAPFPQTINCSSVSGKKVIKHIFHFWCKQIMNVSWRSRQNTFVPSSIGPQIPSERSGKLVPLINIWHHTWTRRFIFFWWATLENCFQACGLVEKLLTKFQNSSCKACASEARCEGTLTTKSRTTCSRAGDQHQPLAILSQQKGSGLPIALAKHCTMSKPCLMIRESPPQTASTSASGRWMSPGNPLTLSTTTVKACPKVRQRDSLAGRNIQDNALRPPALLPLCSHKCMLSNRQ